MEAKNSVPQLEIGLPEHIDPSALNWKQEKKLRKVPFFSGDTLKYQRIPMCGHKFRFGTEPRNRNCESCWFTFFNSHKDLVEAVDEVFTKFGASGLSQLRDPKFTRNFTRFMSTVANWKKAADAAKETQAEAEKTIDEQNSIATASGSGEDSGTPASIGLEAGINEDYQQDLGL